VMQVYLFQMIERNNRQGTDQLCQDYFLIRCNKSSPYGSDRKESYSEVNIVLELKDPQLFSEPEIYLLNF
jgi:hypothetical protein